MMNLRANHERAVVGYYILHEVFHFARPLGTMRRRVPHGFMTTSTVFFKDGSWLVSYYGL